MTKLKMNALFALLTAGLIFGSAAQAAERGFEQQENVAYAVTLIDAAGKVATAASTEVRVQVTVSIPRTGTKYSVPVSAVPARVMFRKHSGDETAFDGSLYLKQDAPYAAGTTTPTTAYDFYPMPQNLDTPNRTAISSGTAESAYESYVVPGLAHDPARWEATYVTEPFEVTGGTCSNELIAALLDNNPTHEWYVASRYGLSSATRVSDIQDHGRKMTFRELRLWEPVAGSTITTQDSAYVTDAYDKTLLGEDYEWTLKTLKTWHIYHGSVGSSGTGEPGLQLLNQRADSTDYDELPRVESPVYPGGIRSVSFNAFAPDPTLGNGADAQVVLVQWKKRTDTTWTTVEEVPITTSSPATPYVVDFSGFDGARSDAQFRLVRKQRLAATGMMSSLVLTIRDVIVRSASPSATVGAPAIVGQPNALEAFEIGFTMVGDTTTPPKGYDAKLQVRRRAKDDPDAAWHTVLPKEKISATANATATFAFAPGTLLTNEDYSTNAAEGAFFRDVKRNVTGFMPGVYDLKLAYNVLGAFAAGREIMEQREGSNENEVVEATTYEATLTDHDGVYITDGDGNPITAKKPYVLEVREQKTEHNRLFARVQYRSGTSDASVPYTLKTVDIPLLPSAKEANKWRVDIATTLRMAEDDTARYAWGYDPDPAVTEDESFTLDVLSFNIHTQTHTPLGDTRTIYGQEGAVNPAVMPTKMTAVPALTTTMKEGGAPFVVELNGLPNSHVMVEVSFPTGQDPQISLGGSYWQDFNTWYAPSMNFTSTEFREDVNSVVADFNCEVDKTSGVRLSGWIPDDGPLATTTSFVDRFEVARGEADDAWALSVFNDAEIATKNFAAWGASHEEATPSILNAAPYDVGGYRTEYIQLDSGVETVLTREGATLTAGNTYRPDAQLRLRGGSQQIRPLDDGQQNIVLKGVGKVSFTVGRSIPYDISKMARLYRTATGAQLDAYGFSAGVQLETPATTCAASGYSVSYYLVADEVYYELRLTQIAQFGEASSKPEPCVVGELYKWSGSTVERLELTTTGTEPRYYRTVSTTLAGNTYAIRIDKDGYLHAGFSTGMTTQATFAFKTKTAVASTGDHTYGVAMCSAECLPIFRNLSTITSNHASNGFQNTASVDSTTVKVLKLFDTPWYLSKDGTATQIRRQAPSADEGAVIVAAVRNGTTVRQTMMTVVKTGDTFESSLGATNATLIIKPASGANVFIDNLSVSSWNGNDANRNGDRVPGATNKGFETGTGFAGVGLWVQPRDAHDFTTSPTQYSGEQVVLLQRSRMNAEVTQNSNATDLGETVFPDDTTTNTGNRLALYAPYSANGFGTVSFRYRVPSVNEFNDSGTMAPVYVMLQHSPTTSNDFLNAPLNNWVNVSEPVELRETGDKWSVASITPRFNGGKGEELSGTAGAGTLRLVMVTKGLTDTEDPYVYIDDFTITDNSEGPRASWTAENVKLTDEPINQLYWKDRLAATVAPDEAPEDTFAEKSVLTRALQLNDVKDGQGVDGSYMQSVLTSPELLEGVGRVTFSARLIDEPSTATRIYLYASEKSDGSEMRAVTYVDVENTVYKTYELDLSKLKTYPTGDAFNCASVRRLQLRTLLQGDGMTTDAFGVTPTYERVLIDQVVIDDPIRPSLRIAKVAFSNVVGAHSPNDFDRTSPLSQPVAAAPVMRAMVSLDQVQLLDESSIRVFLTFNPDSPGTGADNLIRETTAGTSYTDVLGNTVEARTDSPIYLWNPTKLAAWSAETWFNRSAAETAARNAAGTGDILGQLSGIMAENTIELDADPAGGLLFYADDIAKLELEDGRKLTELPPNSVVRYMAWAVYQSTETQEWYVSLIEPQHYTDFPWYFPRNLNLEIQELAGDTSLFSPYYWVYNSTPGEVFLNEINVQDATDAAPSTGTFYEICAPVKVNIGGWRLSETRDTSTQFDTRLVTGIGKNAADLLLDVPNVGVVPIKRQVNTAANRSFYTVFGNTASSLYYMAGTTKQTGYAETYHNAGAAQTGYWTGSFDGRGASSVMLSRPTGGAEHILVYTQADANNAKDAMNNVERLHKMYKDAYAAKGFGDEWYQAFVDTSWQAESTTFGDINRETTEEQDLAKLHGRRLAKAISYPVLTGTDERYAPNGDTFSYANDRATKQVGSTPVVSSIATVDMGGYWVTRKNAVVTDAVNGPADLTMIMTGTWPSGVNPTVSPRGTELPADTAHSTGAEAPWVQVTPRQINPNQYMLPYTGLEQSMVMSTIEAGMGTHSLTLIQDDVEGVPMTAGRNSPNTWAVAKEVLSAKLTYTALPFHKLTSVSIRMTKCEDGSVIEDPRPLIQGWAGGAPDTERWVTVNLAAETASFTLTMGDSANLDLRYNVEAKATFVLDPTLAKGMIKRVGTYGGATLPSQPWWGSSFGFEVEGETDPDKTRGATLSSVIVTFPTPAALADATFDWTTLDASWTGSGLGLNGQTPEDVKQALADNGLRYVELTNGTQGLFHDATVMGILSDTYARAMGYDPENGIYTNKEPAIPFCVWGVYSFTVQSTTGNERVSFVLRQDTLTDNPGIFTIPTWYQPLAPKSTAVPYFYLYSTPPEAAWLSEVNLAQGTGEAPYAEVVLPELRQGILNANVPQTSIQGWAVRNYKADGTQEGVDVTLGEASEYGSTSYRYHLASIPANTATPTAYVLIRPCGAAEGGVWTGVDDDGNTKVDVPATGTWLSDAASHVVSGVTDSNTEAGSVQLVGQTETLPDIGTQMISSDIEKRTEWVFAAESKQENNDGIPPDIIPSWNRVTILSSLRNTVYGGTLCGYQRVPGLFDTTTAVGTASTEGTITASLAGGDWVYTSANPRVLSYRPRSNYRFEQLSLPKDLIGKVMLIGKDLALDAATLDAEVTRLKSLAAINNDARYTDWIQMGRDSTGATRAKAETRTYTDADGNTQTEYTGVITFNPDFLETPFGAEETITFGDLDSFVVTLVFVVEPSSAENAIEMAMGQGEVKTGAWLISQTFYAIDATTGLPDATKGGDVVNYPIWADEDGATIPNGDGTTSIKYADQHGWVYQPIVGDHIGMTAVINPELGLLNGLFAGGTLESVRDTLEAAAVNSGTVRPMLVWTLIDTAKVPTDLFEESPSSKEYSAFLDGWDLSKWLGSVPSVGDGLTYDLQYLRQTLQANIGTSGSLYAKAGILPMVYTGYCSESKELGNPAAATPPTRAQDTLLAFRTMTADELTTALGSTSTKLDNASTDLLPYTSAIEMVNAVGETAWNEGAILRFAVILVDTDKNTIYDCQSISNFSSEKSDVYCPWYLPDETTNINTHTKQKEKGISPYAWVYSIPEGGVWLNEIRPFAEGDDVSGTTLAHSAIELAMYASPYTTQTDASGDIVAYLPTYSLDGWKIVTRVAHLPHASTPLEEQIQWVELQSIPLKSWVPYRRISPSTTSGNTHYYDLDYYAMATDVATGFGGGESFKQAPYEDESDVNTFQWLKLKREIFGAEDNEAIDKLINTDPATIPYATQTSKYTDADILYAIALERANGVVVDEFLFYRAAHKLDYNSDGKPFYNQLRIERAVEMENARNNVVGEVRALSSAPIPSTPYSTRTVQFLKTPEPSNTLFWYYGSTDNLITLVGMNVLGENVQPRLILDGYLPTTSAILSAQVMGGPGALSILSGAKTLASASSVATSLTRGSEYTLTLSGLSPDWFRLESVTKNGKAHTYTPAETYVTYTLSATNALSTTTGIVVDDAILEKDTDYTLTFVYTPDAEKLLAAGDLNSEDDGFLEWLLQVDPGAILDQTQSDGITAAEKYWLGLSSAIDVANVELTFKEIGTHLEPNATEAQPMLAISFTKDGAPITQLTGDGTLVLLGKEKMTDEWQYIRSLTTDDVNGAKELILSTPCTFFKAVLLSRSDAEDLRD